MTNDNPLAPARNNPADTEARKSHYGDGIQPWDIILSAGWGPPFAAANVVKYLRRTKNPEHSLESARWYYKQLLKGYVGEIKSPSSVGDWIAAFDRLEFLLTLDERRLARG